MVEQKTGRVVPCVTAAICVAGCSTTTSRDLPHARGLPPPDFTRTLPRIERVATARPAPAMPAPKPVTVSLPMAAAIPPPRPDPAPSAPTMVTQFEPVAESYLQTGLAIPAKVPYFTPIQTAEAILEPLVEPAAPDRVILPEPIAYPRYVSVGPEYFGEDSSIAPYVISRAPGPLPNEAPIRERTAIAMRPKPIAETTLADATPLPQRSPRHSETSWRPYVEVAAATPGLPPEAPIPAEFSTPIPGTPPRQNSLRPAAVALRTETVEIDEASLSPWAAAVHPSAAYAHPTSQVPLDPSPLYSVSMAPPEQSIRTASLDPTPAIPAEVEPSAPAPTLARIPASPTVTHGDRTSGVSPSPELSSPANDSDATNHCHVNRGSGERMILVCKGVDVSQSDVFRAVVEGESAFRGLRSFQTVDTTIDTYGFNPERFRAMSLGPKSARDLVFLRTLRKSGKRLRVKGRDFALYLMKGDLSLATVLVEEVATAIPNAAAAR